MHLQVELKNKINSGIHEDIEVGISKNMINYKINLNINKLFNIHTAVLGNSGSGKFKHYCSYAARDLS